MTVLWILVASEGDFCGSIVSTANCGKMKGWVFPVLIGQQGFRSTCAGFYIILVLHFIGT